MTYPLLIPIGSWRVHPHVFFEALAYAVAAALFLWLRRRHGDSLSGSDRLSLVAAIFVGALIGSRLLAWIDNPAAQSQGQSGATTLRDLLCCLPHVLVPASLSYENIFRVIIMQFIDHHAFDVRSVKK